MKSHAITCLGAAAALALAACTGAGSRMDPTVGGPVAGRAALQRTATLMPQGGSGASGTVTVRPGDTPQQTVVIVTVNGGPASTNLPWHIHRGSCGSDQGILGSPAAYPQLGTSSDGRAQIQTALQVAPPMSGDYMVMVHSSTGNAILCGNLGQGM